MKKPKIINAVAEVAFLSKTEAKRAVDALETIISKALLSGRTATIPGIGKLKVVTRAARLGRNPKTGAQVQVPSKRALTFHVSSTASTADFSPTWQGLRPHFF